MFSKPLAFGLLALSCVTAAAGGAYLATRHNAADAVVTPPHVATAPANAAPAEPIEDGGLSVRTATVPGPWRTTLRKGKTAGIHTIQRACSGHGNCSNRRHIRSDSCSPNRWRSGCWR